MTRPDVQLLPDRTGGPPLRRLLVLLLVSNTAMFALYHGVLSVLLPLQVQAVDPAAKTTNLALVTGISALVAALANPLAGRLSDRTSGRFGRRTPWIVGGAVLSFGGMVLLGRADTVFAILLGWSLVQATMNGYQAALTAVVPDRVPAWRRGVASALAGLGLPIGGVIGTVLAASQAHHLSRGYLLLGVGIVLAAVLFAVAAREPAVGPAEVTPKTGTVRAFLSCLADADVRWVFIGRLLLVLGHFVVATYNLYILQDFAHLPAGVSPAKAVALLSPVGALSMIVAVVAGGVLSDRIGRRKPFVFASSAVAGLAGLIPLAWPTLPGMLVFAVVAGLAFGCFLAVDTALATLVLPSDDDAGRDLGVLNLALAGPQIVAPFAASVIVAHLGGYPAIFVTGALLGVLGGVAILPVRRVR